jgi:putative transcriptional regulator
VSRAGERILRSARNALTFAAGEMADGFVVHVPEVIDVRAIRARQGLSQEQFARRYGFTVAAVRDWEHGRRQPARAARILLRVIEREPEAVRRALEVA